MTTLTSLPDGWKLLLQGTQRNLSLGQLTWSVNFSKVEKRNEQESQQNLNLTGLVFLLWPNFETLIKCLSDKTCFEGSILMSTSQGPQIKDEQFLFSYKQKVNTFFWKKLNLQTNKSLILLLKKLNFIIHKISFHPRASTRSRTFSSCDLNSSIFFHLQRTN